MIVDAHAHVTEARYGDAATLLAAMAAAGIDRAVLVPGGMLDVRQMTAHATGRARAADAPIPNAFIEGLVAERPDRFTAFYCVNPHHGDAAVADFERAVARGCAGLKLAPLVHRFALSDPTVRDLAALCGALDVPFYTHVVHFPGASTDKFLALARDFPSTTFVLGHMGFGPADVEAVEGAAALDNVFLETSGGSFLIVKAALERLGTERLLFGSEFPLYHPKIELEKIRLLARGDAFDRVAGANMEGLLARRAPPIDSSPLPPGQKPAGPGGDAV